MIDSELLVNNISSFDNWLLISDSPTFDDYIFGQSEKDGFLLFQYSRENQINSSASFGFSFYTGSELDTTDYNMDVKIDIRSSWNPLNTKTIPIKSGDYWLLKNTDDLYLRPEDIPDIYIFSFSGHKPRPGDNIEYLCYDGDFATFLDGGVHHMSDQLQISLNQLNPRSDWQIEKSCYADALHDVDDRRTSFVFLKVIDVDGERLRQFVQDHGSASFLL